MKKLFDFKGILICLYLYLRCLMNMRYLLFRRKIKILNTADTIKVLLENQYSVSRFGDGEFEVMNYGGNGFQNINYNLANRLREVISNPIDKHIVCIPLSFKDTKNLRLESKSFAYGFLHANFNKMIYPYVDLETTYCDANFTRFYMMAKDKSKTEEIVSKLLLLWENKDILIVEGEFSRLGVNNDLFSNAKSIKRILCPSKNAFDKYDEILNSVVNHNRGRLVILALVMTATVLAYDLAKLSIRALDLGHIDVEYEWYKMGATEKCAIPGKFVNEVQTTDDSHYYDIENRKYYDQIICKI